MIALKLSITNEIVLFQHLGVYSKATQNMGEKRTISQWHRFSLFITNTLSLLNNISISQTNTIYYISYLFLCSGMFACYDKVKMVERLGISIHV